MGQWINFKELREQVDFETVMQFYGIELKRKKQDQHQGFCPLPGHQGKKQSASFSVNLAKGIFQCFGCGATGNVLDFVCRMEGLNPSNPQEVRRAALMIQERHVSDAAEPPPKPAAKAKGPPPPKAKLPAKVEINTPLDFELKGLDPEHPYLKERGFENATIRHFGLGHCSRGLMQARIVIPIHDADGRLVGYAGRLVDDAAISEQNPKYRFPGDRTRNDVAFVFRKSALLYNQHRVAAPVADLVVVEGFASIWWLYQNGFDHAVAVMGASCSDEQADLIVDLTAADGHVWILTDGDAAGERCATETLTKVSPRRFCRWVKLADGCQPTELGSYQLLTLLAPEGAGDRPDERSDGLFFRS